MLKNVSAGVLIVAFVLLLSACGGSGKKSDDTYVLPPEIEAIPVGVQYGLRAPEIEAENIDGTTFTLSSLRGQLVLVDFWASWCPPCRKENPHLVKLYKRYRDTKFVNGNGLTIVSISLDRNEEAWKQAIETDGLTWSWQICDLQGARSPLAREYEVSAIPASFLLDRNGVIIGTNLRGEQLDGTLEDLVENK